MLITYIKGVAYYERYPAKLFLDNPYIPEQIYTFCNQLPEFREAERAYEEITGRLRAQLDTAEVNTFDEIVAPYLSFYAHAYYLFGLGLRQEVLSALGQAG